MASPTSTSRGSRPRVLYFAVRDEGYPRNERIREYLTRTYDADVTVVPAVASKSRYRRYITLFKSTWRLRTDYDVVILSEFSLNSFPFSWMAAKRSRALHVVDFFVGLHETEVGDAGNTPKRSVRAAALHLCDLGAVLSADVCLTDTAARARRFAANVHNRRPFVDLPVGAPEWARSQAGRARDVVNAKPVHFLYYGSYLPLHGLDRFVRALGEIGQSNFTLTLIGNGPTRPQVEDAVKRAHLEEMTTFFDAVIPTVLAEYIRTADVIVGVFGTSTKASEVIANKVWQGLSMGKVVITRESPALTEISKAAGQLLIQVNPEDDLTWASAFRSVWSLITSAGQPIGIANRLEDYVQSRFDDGFGTPLLVSRLGEPRHRL